MFYAYDAAFTGAGAAETVGSRRRRKEREREGSISSNSSSERTGSPISHSDSKSTSSSEKDSSFGGFGFGFGFRGASKHRKKEPAHPRSLSGSIKDSRSIHTSELSVAPASPADSGVGESLAGSLERLELKADSSSDNQQEIYRARRAQRVPTDWNDAYYEESHGETSVLDLFPLTPPDYTGPNPDRRHSLSRHPSSGTSTPTNSFRGLPTIIDSESEEATRSRTPLPALPNTGRRRTSSTSSAPKTPFQAALARMEAASLKIMVKRLIEDWSGDEDPSEMEDVLFEQNLWSLMARQWLTQGKQLQCPVHEMLLSAHPSDGKRILNLYGTIADGWVLAAKYPSCTVLTLTTAPIPQTSHLWPSPPNHHLAPHHHAIQNPLPFPPNHFDVITSRHFSSTVPAASWISLMRACHVALKPYGWLEIQSLDAPPSRCGPLLTTWLESRLFPSLDSQSLVSKPSELVLDYLEIAGFADIKACKIALPAVMHGDSDSVRVMVQAGRHYYQELFSNAVVRPSGKLTWWWFNKSVRAECEREGSLLGFMISFGQKAG